MEISDSLTIISWDVGVIHLAYCIMKITYHKKTKKPIIEILDWDEVNLIEDDRITLTCCGYTKGKNSKLCGKNARFYMNMLDGSDMLGYCKTHLAQHSEKYNVQDVIDMFVENDQSCTHELRKNKNNEIKLCGKKSKYCCDDEHFCPAHYKSELNKKIKYYSPQPIKNMIVKKYPTAQLQLNMMIKLDLLAERFAKLGVTEVVIENQPSFKNPKMKSIANTLFDYFMMRGMVDNTHGLNINMVKLMAPCNKLKINNDNTIAVFKNNKNDKNKYKLTKELGIQYTKQLLADEPELLEYLDLYKKIDDKCDAYLQGRYYLEIYRNKNITLLEKNFNRNYSSKKNTLKKVHKKENNSEKLERNTEPKKSKKKPKTEKKIKNLKRKSRKSGSKTNKINTISINKSSTVRPKRNVVIL